MLPGESEGCFWEHRDEEQGRGSQLSPPIPEHSHVLPFPGRRLRKVLPAPIAALHLFYSNGFRIAIGTRSGGGASWELRAGDGAGSPGQAGTAPRGRTAHSGTPRDPPIPHGRVGSGLGAGKCPAVLPGLGGEGGREDLGWEQPFLGVGSLWEKGP